jgi:hypothetical protein
MERGNPGPAQGKDQGASSADHPPPSHSVMNLREVV